MVHVRDGLCNWDADNLKKKNKKTKNAVGAKNDGRVKSRTVIDAMVEKNLVDSSVENEPCGAAWNGKRSPMKDFRK